MIRSRVIAALALAACLPLAARGEGDDPAASQQPPPQRAPRSPGSAPGGSGLTLSLEGWRDRTTTGGEETVQAGAISLRGSVRLAGGMRRSPDGFSAWGLTGHADARAVAIDLPEVDGEARFLRLGVALGASYLPSPRTSYTLQAGAFVSEQVRLLGSPRVHPRLLAIGTYRAGEGLRFLYGAFYTHDLGSGFPIPFAGVAWRMAPAWELNVVLPVAVRVSWKPQDALSVSAGATAAFDRFRYRARVGSADEGIKDLRLIRARLGLSCEGRLSPGARVGVDAGVERSWIRTGVSSHQAVGLYAGVSVGLGGGAQDLGGLR